MRASLIFHFPQSNHVGHQPPSKRLEVDDITPSIRLEVDDIDGQPDGCRKEEVRCNPDDTSHNADRRSAHQASLSSFLIEGVQHQVRARQGKVWRRQAWRGET